MQSETSEPNTGLDPRLTDIARAQPNSLLFVSVCGAHLYGTARPGQPYDLRGAHILPAWEVIGLAEPDESIESTPAVEGGELPVEMVTHDVRKFMRMMLRGNGYALEQLYSPLVVHTTEEHDELRAIGRGCLTAHLASHYHGFARTHWELLLRDAAPSARAVLGVYRVLLTGIHLLRTGAMECRLRSLNEVFGLASVDDLLGRLADPDGTLPPVVPLKADELARHRLEYERLLVELDRAGGRTSLPAECSAFDDLNALLVRLRLRFLAE